MMNSNLLTYESLGYDKYLKKILQKNVLFILNDKIIRKGQIILYTYKNFVIQFYVKQNKNTRKTEIPIPFAIKDVNNDSLLLDYSCDIILPDPEANIGKTSSKFYNNQLLIKYND